MVKLIDIANHCQISVTQVSRALNDHDDVSEKTKEMVRQAAKELGYVKNIVASNLANKTPNQIGVMYSDIDNHAIDKDTIEIENNHILDIMRGVNTYAYEFGLEPVIFINNAQNPLDYVDFCRQRRIPGLVIYGCDYDNPDFVNLINSDFPSVAIDILVEEKNHGCVIVNNSYYSQLAINHLVQNGCKKIALISGRTNSHVTVERESGYRLAMRYNGLEVCENLIVRAHFDMETAKRKTLALLQKHSDVDGLFCMSDQMAIGCIEAVKLLGKRIPEDVKVFGFDGIKAGKYLDPGLSSIRQSFKKKGYYAAKLLAQILADEHTERTVVVPCEMVIRASSMKN